MSLKAKVEAVVYAAEEPVTLAQLAAIFAEEVLHDLQEVASDPAPEQISLAGLEGGDDPVVNPQPSEVPAVASDEPVAETPETASEASAEVSKPGEADEKKVARLLDRRVRQALQPVLDALIADYAESDRGMEIREIAGGYRMATKPEYHDAVRGFVKSLKPPMKLSLQALETLAVIAYKQPVTAPEVSEIRGVDSGGVLGGLISRKLISTAGRKPVIGRPILYKTTKEFLLRFGLKDVNDLPSMEEFEKMAGELAESEAAVEAQDAVMQLTEPLLNGESLNEESSGVDHAPMETEETVVPGPAEPAASQDADAEKEEETVAVSPDLTEAS